MARLPSLGVLLVASAASAAWPPGQPLLPVWKPASGENALGEYDRDRDPDAPFARGVFPLARRVDVTPDAQANPHARPGEGRVMVLCPSGFNATETAAGTYGLTGAHAFSFWQYIDSYVYWGGSAGEGNILSPHPGVIDAGHRNGVRVYGTVFFPPNEFGGQIDRVEEMLAAAPDGSFPIADRLIDVMQANGFDGYFINQETVGGDAETATRMRRFMEYFQAHAGDQGELIWYDAMTESGAVRWQEKLNRRNDDFFQHGGEVVAEKMFLDFGWDAEGLREAGRNARRLGRSRFDLYAAVDVEGRGYHQRVNWPAVFPEGKPHRTSLALYVPNWTWNHSRGADPVARVADYRRRESLFWVGANHDPSDTGETVEGGNWRGIAHDVAERTALVGDRFVTNFNLGQGFAYFVDGERLSSEPWTNLSDQDLLPTWRWIVHSASENRVAASLDHDDAYHGGTCLRVRGTLDAANELPLYAARLDLHEDTRLSVVTKAEVAGESARRQVVVTFADSPDEPAVYNLAPSRQADWVTEEFGLGEHAGRQVTRIGLRLLPGAEPVDCDFRVGRLAIARGEPREPDPPSNVRFLQESDGVDPSRGLRLRWDPSGSPVRCYHLFVKRRDGSRTFIDATPRCFGFVRPDCFEDPAGVTGVEVVAVSERFVASAPAELVGFPRED